MADHDELLPRAEEHLAAMEVVEALALFEQAERAKCNADQCAGGRWTCHMLNGDFERAWLESDQITKRGNPDPDRFWNGQPLDGKRVLIRCLHGLGDTIQFIRYAQELRKKARAVFIEAQPTLKRLLASSDLADEVITWRESEPAWDEQVEVVELPRIFRTELGSVPNNVPYLKTPQSYSGAASLRVGIVWSSSQYNPARSIPAEIFARLFDIRGINFFSLQAGPERYDLKPWNGLVPSLYNEESDCLETAAKLQTLDLVITVDTMMAHLAGALGRPVWTILPHRCDWRWMLKRSDSPWYPTMRLIRQQQAGGWVPVIESVKEDLRRYAEIQALSLNRRSG
ncbi:MAG: ADP-heptose--LPS heptosyltransferase [Acidobacteriota bacterium]|nr:ADP-heptose--LPS heptosyltransferase [Acidobacteriota bacterium]